MYLCFYDDIDEGFGDVVYCIMGEVFGFVG